MTRPAGAGGFLLGAAQFVLLRDFLPPSASSPVSRPSALVVAGDKRLPYNIAFSRINLISSIIYLLAWISLFRVVLTWFPAVYFVLPIRAFVNPSFDDILVTGTFKAFWLIFLLK
jgi:hypothetical protein